VPFFDRVFAVLDSRFLSRVGSLGTLVSIGGIVGAVLVAIVVALVYPFARAGWVPLLFLGLALLLAVLLVLTRLRARKERRSVGSSAAEVAARLQVVAGEIEDFYHEREVEEPRRAQSPGVSLPLQFEREDGHYEALATYRKKTMALYYREHRRAAVAAFDACSAFGYTAGREQERSIIYKPLGTAALALVPGILRDMGWKLAAS
jgi:ABC-type multidrug transport system fused ATPase/permease subunit